VRNILANFGYSREGTVWSSFRTLFIQHTVVSSKDCTQMRTLKYCNTIDQSKRRTKSLVTFKSLHRGSCRLRPWSRIRIICITQYNQSFRISHLVVTQYEVDSKNRFISLDLAARSIVECHAALTVSLAGLKRANDAPNITNLHNYCTVE